MQNIIIKPLPTSLNLLQTSIKELSSLLTQGTITSVDLVSAYLTNIERDNKQGRGLNAVIQVAPRESVLQIAHALDQERRDGKTRGYLHGIPVLVKDNIATHVELGMKTSAGNTALEQSVVPGDAEVIKRLRAAGAIILAKTNLTELAKHKYPTQPNGWSAVGGQCYSAYVRGEIGGDGDPLGSSTGSATGLSAGFGAIAIGTETAGSLICSASRAALCTLRPTAGLVPNQGIVPVSWDQDTAGAIGFSVADVAIVLDVLTNGSGRYYQASSSPEMCGLRFGLIRGVMLDNANPLRNTAGSHIEISLPAILEAVEVIRQAGAIVMDVEIDLNESEISILMDNHMTVTGCEFKEDMTTYLETLVESPVRSIEDLIQWNITHHEQELPPYAPSQQFLLEAISTSGRDSDLYRNAKAISTELAGKRGMDYIFNGHNLDAAICAVDIGAPYFYSAITGYATGTVPLGQYQNGMPFGILFIVRPGSEAKLISIMSACEALLPKRKIPW